MTVVFIILKCVISYSVIVIYYNWAKQYIFKIAPSIARICKLTKHYPVSAAAGVVQLFLIALSHALLCVLLIFLLRIQCLSFFKVNLLLMSMGCLIGIGCVGLSTILCQTGMMAGELFFPSQVPGNAQGWFTIARGGWMRHHLHNIEILPLWIALLIVLVQVSCEEIIFRGLLFDMFSGTGKCWTILISTILFSYMQTFHMSSRTSAMFPVIGASVLGAVNGLLYSEVPMLLPLIAAHLAFFMIAVL